MFREFCGKYFPEYENAKMICESWMILPALFELLDEKSNVLSFNKRFEIESADYENKGVLDWFFPGYKKISKELPEKTSLQRKMKAYLLEGKRVGWAKDI